MNVLDIILGVFLLILMFNGFRKGFIKNVIGLLGLVVIVFFIAKTGHLVKALLITKFEIGEILATILSYILIALIITIVAKIVIKILHMIIDFLRISWLNKLLGTLFGLFNGALIIAIIILLLNLSPLESAIRKGTSNSRIITTIRLITERIETDYPEIKKLQKPVQEKMKKVEEEIDEKFKDALID